MCFANNCMVDSRNFITLLSQLPPDNDEIPQDGTLPRCNFPVQLVYCIPATTGKRPKM